MINYALVESIHIIANISWMCGLLYLPRLFIYHNRINKEGEAYPIFALMEKRLFWYITTPASCVSLITGTILAWASNAYHSTWFAIKFLSIVSILILHIYFGCLMRKFRTQNNFMSDCRLRILNELVTILMVIVVFMVVMKPL